MHGGELSVEPPPLGTAEGLHSREVPRLPCHAECVASHFVVCGFAPGQLEPNVRPPDEGWALEAVCTIARGEAVPEGFTLLTTASGHRASIGADALQLAYRLRPLQTVGLRPITGIEVLPVDQLSHLTSPLSPWRGVRMPAGFEPVRRVSGAERGLGERGPLLGVNRDPAARAICSLSVVIRERQVGALPPHSSRRDSSLWRGAPHPPLIAPSITLNHPQPPFIFTLLSSRFLLLTLSRYALLSWAGS